MGEFEQEKRVKGGINEVLPRGKKVSGKKDQKKERTGEREGKIEKS